MSEVRILSGVHTGFAVLPQGAGRRSRLKGNTPLKIRVILFLAACLLALIPLLDSTQPAADTKTAADTAADRDSLEAMVRYLSIDPSTSEPRSRYIFREAELGKLADSLAARLEDYTGSTALRQG